MLGRIIRGRRILATCASSPSRVTFIDGESPFAPTILPRKGEVAGACQTEGEENDGWRSVSAPSVAFGATFPWRGRIVPIHRP